MILELIVAGGWLFWAIIGALCLLELVFVGKEVLWPTIILPIVSFIAISLFSTTKALTYCQENWKHCLYVLGAYIVIACLWATFKWYRRCIRRGKIYANCLEKWAEKNMPAGVHTSSVNDIPIHMQVKFFQALKTDFYVEAYGREEWGMSIDSIAKYGYESPAEYAVREREHVSELKTDVLKKVLSSPKENKDLITVWMVAWPFSILSTLVFDFLYDFFGWIRKSLAGLFIEIARMSFGKYRKDFDAIKIEKEI